MPKAIVDRPCLITHQNQLDNLAAALLCEPMVAVDTESNSLHAYQEQVCLIQCSTAHTDYLVDPLSLDDLTPLQSVFASAEIEKVFHAAEYDLICLRRDFGYEFNRIFDTMLAARILGRSGVGLGTILEHEFGIQLDKRYQRADWGQRPLPGPLLDYARLDSHYLIDLRQVLIEALEGSGKMELAQEDFKRLCKIANARPYPEETPNEQEICWRINGSHDFSPRQYAVMQELCRYRDRAAKAMDRPLFKVIGNKTLLDIAGACPKTLDELRMISGMTHKQIDRHGRSILQAVQQGLTAQPVYPARQPRPSEAYLNRLEALREWRKRAAGAMSVESDIILPRDLLQELAEKNPRSESELAEVLLDVPWRLKNFGSQILAVIKRA